MFVHAMWEKNENKKEAGFGPFKKNQKKHQNNLLQPTNVRDRAVIEAHWNKKASACTYKSTKHFQHWNGLSYLPIWNKLLI